MHQITDASDLEAAFEAPLFLLLKHSTVCPVSAYAKRQVEAFETGRADVPVGWIDVRESRPLARAVAERTGVEHESPQVFLLKSGEVAWHDSHYGIKEATLVTAVEEA